MCHPDYDILYYNYVRKQWAETAAYRGSFLARTLASNFSPLRATYSASLSMTGWMSGGGGMMVGGGVATAGGGVDTAGGARGTGAAGGTGATGATGGTVATGATGATGA